MADGPDIWPKHDLVSLLEWIDEVADRFETRWQEGVPAPVAEYVGTASGAPRRQLLKELIRIDMDWRRRRGEDRRLEDYLGDWPELLGPDGTLPDDLVQYAAHAAAPASGAQAATVIHQPHESAGGAGPAATTANGATESLPRTLGKFQLLERLGQGGFGVVYKARDTELGRTVAVKVPRAGAFGDAQEQERFLREARSAAQLRHPNIVQVHEVATVGVVVCIVSSYVQGRTLAQLLTERRPSFAETAHLIAVVADALNYAHRMQVIHRDVNPRNILVDEAGQPHVADFGLALRAGADLTLTAAGQVLGTPLYMSPEQAAGRSHEADQRTDVYSLGVVLYEMLTGQRPFAAEGPLLFHRIVNDDPCPPRRVDRRIPRDLETICLKALAKAPAQRYATAAEFADDLRRFLRDEPVRARAAGPVWRLMRWCRRNPAIAALTAAVFLSLVAVAGALVQAVQSGREREQALQRESVALLRAVQAGRERELSLQRESLIQQVQRLRREFRRTDGWSDRAWVLITQAAGIERDRALRSQAVATLAGLDARRRQHFPELVAGALTFDADGEHLLMAGVAQEKKPTPHRRWNRTTRALEVLAGNGAGPMAFDAEGTCCQVTLGDGPACVLRDVTSGRALTTRPMPAGRCDVTKPVHLAVSDDATHFAAAFKDPAGKGMVLAWNTDSNKPILAWEGAAAALAFAPQATLLAAGDDQGRVRVWSLADGEIVASFEAGRTLIQCLAFSPDGRRLAIAGSGGTVALWDHRTNLTTQLFGSEYDVAALTFSPDGTLLASGGRGASHVWDVAAGRLLLDILAGDYVKALAFGPEGDMLAVSSRDDGVSVWTLQDGCGIRTLRGLASPVAQVKLAADDASLAGFTGDGLIAVWRLPSGRLRRLVEGPRGPFPDNAALAFSPDGRRLAASAGAEAILWDLDGGERAWTLPPGGLNEVLAFSPTGQLLLFRTEPDAGRRLGRVRDLSASLTPLYSIDEFNKGALAASATPDGTCFIVTGNHQGPEGKLTRIKAYEAANGRVRWELSPSKYQHSSGHWMETEGRFLALGGFHETDPATLVDVADGKVIEHFKTVPLGLGRGAELLVQHAHPDPSASAGVQALRRRNENEPFVLLAMDNPGILRLIFSRTGNLIAWGNVDGTVTVCDLEQIRRKLAEIELEW